MIECARHSYEGEAYHSDGEDEEEEDGGEKENGDDDDGDNSGGTTDGFMAHFHSWQDNVSDLLRRSSLEDEERSISLRTGEPRTQGGENRSFKRPR